MPQIVYALCAMTSTACAVLLWRAYRRRRTRLLLWSSLAFIGLAANNGLLFIDLVIVPSIDLSMPRTLTALAAVMVLLFGLVWDAQA
jgi:hypothetical protein